MEAIKRLETEAIKAAQPAEKPQGRLEKQAERYDAQTRRQIRTHHAMAFVGGFFGIYAILTRDGTFGSAETGNLIYLVVSGLTRSGWDFLLRLGALLVYALGIACSVLIRRYWNPTYLRWCALAADAAACFLLAWIPAEADPLAALYPVFFVTAVQWTAYSQAAGYKSATIFSTNNLRQCAEGATEYLCTRETRFLRQFQFYGATLLCFHLGVAYGWFCVERWGVSSIYACLPPLALGAWFTWNEESGARN